MPRHSWAGVQEIDINFTSLRQDAHCTRGFGSGGSFLSHDHVQRTDRLTDKAREGNSTAACKRRVRKARAIEAVLRYGGHLMRLM